MSRRKTGLALIAIIALAAVLRIWGLDWGLPTSRHYFSYHPDETVTLFAALKVDFFNGHLNPGFYNYGSLFIYLTNLAILAGSLAGVINLPEHDIFSAIGEFAKLYLAGRIVAVILAIGTVYLVYVIGRRAYGRAIGLVAALFMAILPIHVMHSHYLAVDVPATFFVAAALVFAMHIPEYHKLRYYLLAGLFAGLAAGTKYNTGLVILSPIVAHLSTAEEKPCFRIFNPKLLAVLASGAVGFFIGTPGVLLYRSEFMRGFLYEVRHAATGHGLVFADTPVGFVYHVSHSLLPGVGLPLLILAGIGLLYALAIRRPVDLTLLAFLLTYYFVIGIAQVKFARYTIPMLPALTILAARVVCRFYERLMAGELVVHLARYVLTLLLTAVVVYTLAYSMVIDLTFARTDTRDAAVAWVRRNVPVGMSIGLPTCPWFYTPPLDPLFGLPDPSDRKERVSEFTDYVLVLSERDWNAALLDALQPDYVIMSEFEYYDVLRVKDPNALQYFDVLEQYYVLEKEFKSLVSRYSRLFVLGPIPHDLSYASPTIRIYSRKVQ